MLSKYIQSFTLPLFLLPLIFVYPATASVTVYGYAGAVASSTVSGAQPQYTGMQAYNPVTLQPPPLPVPLPANAFNIAVHKATPNGVSIKLRGSFMGFSIEFSVLNQVLGSNSSVLQVPFLNLMANIKERVGSVYIRVGGNTQETASLVDSLPNGEILYKDNADTNNPTKTPPLEFTEDLIYMMANISSLVNIQWFMGIPFNDTSNWRLEIAEKGQAILGNYLVGLQVGNEPDLYAKHGRRPATYSPTDYGNEFGQLVNAVRADPNIPSPNMLIAPNLAGIWKPDEVWVTGFAQTYQDSLGALAVERYPTDNCFARYGYGIYHDAQAKFATYMTHTSGQQIVSEYLTSQALAQQLNKPLMMFETNSASCGGFPGIADAYGASLWALDYALQMAYSNFSVAMFHIGGQNVSYNPFIPPPTVETFYHQWTVGPVYYAALAMAETLGPTNTAQVIDLFPNNASEFTPAYAIYENGVMARMALFNYMDDPSGANDYTATISVGGGALGEANGTPAQVQVKYLSGGSVAQKGNITWGGQTFGGYYESDGRPQGTEQLQTVTCDTNANTCQIKVPAPGFALVFFSEPTLADPNGAQQTFATTVQTRTVNTVTVAQDALATSNGNRGNAERMGSTSPNHKNAAPGHSLPNIIALAGLLFGGILFGGLL
jgi:hypothetical protein